MFVDVDGVQSRQLGAQLRSARAGSRDGRILEFVVVAVVAEQGGVDGMCSQPAVQSFSGEYRER